MRHDSCCAAVPREHLMTLRGRAAIPFLLVLAFAIAPSIPSRAVEAEPCRAIEARAATRLDAGAARDARPFSPIPIRGTFLDLADHEGLIGRTLDPGLVEGILASLRRGLVRSDDPQRTALDAARLASGLLREPLAAATPGSEDFLALQRLALGAALETTVDLHPELRDALFDAWRNALGPSPVEILCECVRGGSWACGCDVHQTGPGACEFSVNCQTHWKATCFGINIDGCVAKVIMMIVRAAPDSAVP
jgi:hypothetical protein